MKIKKLSKILKEMMNLEVVETTLVRSRFPIKGNKTKQIQYKLISWRSHGN